MHCGQDEGAWSSDGLSLLFFVLRLPHKRLRLLPETVSTVPNPALSALLSGKLESPLRLLRAPQTGIYSGPVKKEKKKVGNTEDVGHLPLFALYLKHS